LFFFSSSSYHRDLHSFPTRRSSDLSDQVFVIEAQITIINVQSYPVVGGTWQVRFNTTGTANLTITTVNGTTWSDSNENNDLKFLSVTCGNQTTPYQWVNGSVLVPNYSCSEIGTETSKVMTQGTHHLEFRFGSDVKYANNFATGPVPVVTNSTSFTDSSPTATGSIKIPSSSNRILLVGISIPTNVGVSSVKQFTSPAT